MKCCLLHPYKKMTLYIDNLSVINTLYLCIISKPFILFAFVVIFSVFSMKLYSHFQLCFDQDLFWTFLFELK